MASSWRSPARMPAACGCGFGGSAPPPAAGGVPGREGATHPFWSPDSQHVGFFAGGWLKRVALATREVRQIAPAPEGDGATWNDHGDILFVADTNAPVSHVSASGGEVRAVTVLGSGLRV